MTRTIQLRFALLLGLTAVALATGCGSQNTEAPTFEVDQGMRPETEAIEFADGSGRRPLATIADNKGNTIDFVEDEVIVTYEDASELNAIRERLGATVLREIDPVAAGAPDGTPKFALLRVAPPNAEPGELVELILSTEGNNISQHQVSSQNALNALTAMARESVEQGTTLGANFLVKYDGLSQRELLESPTGDRADYSPDAFDWPYMSQGSAQDIGAAEAARLVRDSGSVPAAGDKIDFLIIDGGFLNLADFPSPVILPSDAFGRPNPSLCSGGNPCPFHGTQVASAALSVLDNGIGSAGPAADVVRPIFVQAPNPNFWDYLEYVFVTLPTAFGTLPEIVNISASGDIPAGLCLVGVCTIVNEIARNVRRAGILVFASAGNDGANVDDEDCIWVFGERCWESRYRVPCEAPGVVCVGGLEHDMTVRAANSAFGQKQRSDGDSVDIYAPFRTWVHRTPTGTDAQFVSGTSFSSPFAAAIGALIKAANPSLGPGGIWDTMRRTAHTLERGGVHRWVNAHAAVHEALGGNAPPFAKIEQPTDGRSFALRAQSVPLVCDVDDADGMDTVDVSWRSNLDGAVGGPRPSTSSLTLSAGMHEITCTADDGEFVATDTVTVMVINEAPLVRIVQPITETEYFAAEPILVAASATDRNGDFSHVSWELTSVEMVMIGGVPGLGGGREVPIEFSWWSADGIEQTVPGGLLDPGVYTLTATAYDDDGESSSDQIIVRVAPNPVDARPVLSNPNVFATPAADPNDNAPFYYWVDGCTVDITGDGRVDANDHCQRLVFRIDAMDDHDALEDLEFFWVVRLDGSVVETNSSSTSPSFDLPVGNYEVIVTVTDTAGNESSPYAWSFYVSTLI